MTATSSTLRRKIAILEGVDLEDDDSQGIEEETIECSRDVMICADKVMANVVGWDDIALAELIEAITNLKIQRLSAIMDSEAAISDWEDNDTLIVNCLTDTMKYVKVLLKGILLLLPSTDAMRSITQNALTLAATSLKDKSSTTVYSVTFVKTHGESTFESFQKDSTHPWVKLLSFGPEVEPWNVIQFKFISLQEFEKYNSPTDSPLSTWCWFMSHHTTCQYLSIPKSVMSSDGICAMWRRLAQVTSHVEDDESNIACEGFTELWGQAVIAEAVTFQEQSIEHDKKISDAKIAMSTQRVNQFRDQINALESARLGP